MSSISVNTITDASGGSTTSINGFTPSVSNMTGRNRIINGDMRIDQRNAGAAVTLGTTSSSTYGADRFMVEQGGVTANTGTVQQVSDAPTGFKKSIKYTGGAATYNSQGFTAINQRIEGLNLTDSDYGTASAKQFTLSFWVKASVTGTYSINFTHYDGSSERWLLQTYIVDSANTWEKKTITINGDTAYSIPADNGATGWMRVYWALGGDSNSMQGTVTGNWVAGSGSNRAVSGQVNVATTSGATFYITGVQLEAGSVATPFEHRQYGQELALCQRYCIQTTYYGTATSSNGAMGSYGAAVAGSNWMWGFVYFPTVMRAQPSVKTSDNAGNFEKLSIWTSGGGSVTNNISPYSIYPIKEGFNFSDYYNAKNGVFIGGYLATAEL